MLDSNQLNWEDIPILGSFMKICLGFYSLFSQKLKVFLGLNTGYIGQKELSLLKLRQRQPKTRFQKNEIG